MNATASLRAVALPSQGVRRQPCMAACGARRALAPIARPAPASTGLLKLAPKPAPARRPIMVQASSAAPAPAAEPQGGCARRRCSAEKGACHRRDRASALACGSAAAAAAAAAAERGALATLFRCALRRAGIKWGADLKKLAICVGLGAAVWFAPPPAGVTLPAWHLLAIFLGTIAGIITQPMPLGAVAMMGLAATMLTKTLSFAAAFSAFANEIP